VALNQLALTLSDMGRYEDAEPILRRVARDFRESVGEAHYYSGSSLTQLAHALHMNGKLEEAESSFRAGLEIVAATLPENHAALVLTHTRFGALLVTLGRFAEAEPMLLRSYEILQSRQGPHHAQTREAAAALAQLYESVDRLDHAARYRGDLAAAAEASP
jgi:tetratricopeptide (TPR) repeat protein